MPPAATAPPSPAPGPAALGRGVVVDDGQPAPSPWADAPRLRVDAEVVADPGPVADVLHRAWLTRRPVVIELAADNGAVREPQACHLPPYQLPRDFAFHRERLHALTWANTYDARSGEVIWWHGVLAQRRTDAQPSPTHDITLPDGRGAFVDGGPRGPVAGLAEPLVHRESVALGRLTVLGTAAPGDDLASDQLAAVTHAAGPARIIAPAGSGKTRVLTSRLRHLLHDRGYEPELVTAVAYNTRAANEMRERTSDLAAGGRAGGGRVSIRTLHSLALWICRMDRDRTVIDERQQRALLERLIRVGRIPNQDPYKPYLEALAEVRLGLVDPVEVELQRGDVDDLPRVVDDYRRELDRRDLLDFDEQIYRALELLLTDPAIRRRAQRAGTHLLVDEFQDLTPAFLLLVRLVAGPTQQVFAVGDDDQTIYSYAGATPAHLVDFDRWFPGAHHHALEVNYRCPAAVVDAATRLLSHNRDRVAKTIRAGAEVPA